MTNPTNQAGGVAEPVSLELAKGVIQAGYDAVINALKSEDNDPEVAPKAVRDFLNAALATKPAAPAERWNAVVQLAHRMDDAAHGITEREAYDFATELRVLAGLDGEEAANAAADVEGISSKLSEIRGRLAALRTPAQAPSTGAKRKKTAQGNVWEELIQLEGDALMALIDLLGSRDEPSQTTLAIGITQDEDGQEVRGLHGWSTEYADEGMFLIAELPMPAPPVVQPASPAVEVASDPLQGAVDWLKTGLVDATVTDIQSRLLIGYNRARRLFDGASPTQAPAATEAPGACAVPPAGWFCSQKAGHEGPCAARRERNPFDGQAGESSAEYVRRLNRLVAPTTAAAVGASLKEAFSLGRELERATLEMEIAGDTPHDSDSPLSARVRRLTEKAQTILAAVGASVQPVPESLSGEKSFRQYVIDLLGSAQQAGLYLDTDKRAILGRAMRAATPKGGE